MPLLWPSPTLSDSSLNHSHADRHSSLHTPPQTTISKDNARLTNLKAQTERHLHKSKPKTPLPTDSNTATFSLQMAPCSLLLGRIQPRSNYFAGYFWVIIYGHVRLFYFMCRSGTLTLFLFLCFAVLLGCPCPHSLFQQVAAHSYLNTSISVSI